MSYTSFGFRSLLPGDATLIAAAYNDGYVFTRTEIGHMERIRSLRINLHNFSESSENRRILRKYTHQLNIHTVPYPDYTWEIHKLGKDFYDTKFGPNTFSANKIKELFTMPGFNFNHILTFTAPTGHVEGYCIVYADNNIVHYAYPFYKLELINSSFGIYMMTKAIQHFHALGLEYIYLGSVHEPASLYKLQFKGLEWWDEQAQTWSTDLDVLKARAREQKINESV
jgi:arginyl-tRNA--protein-N-Asp/Glu arginylyltransferase